MLGLMGFLVFEGRRAVGSDCRDPRMGHVCYGVTNSLSSGVRIGIDNYGLAQFVARCKFDSATGYLAYRHSV